MDSHASVTAQEYWSTKAAPRLSLLDHLSPQASPQELAVARHALDNELYALHMIMCAMRTRRNNVSLIGRLPPEILSCIFSFHAINQPVLSDPIYNPNDPFPSGYRYGPTRLGLGWIAITHVCRHWRQVALSDPTLWRTIVFDLGTEWAEEMLARSKATLISYCRDLSFRPRVSRGRSVDDELTLRKHLSHIQRLVLSGHPDTLAPAVRALTTPAPYLESLELYRDASLLHGFCITLPYDLFAHKAPNLRHVTLVGCAVPWDSPCFRDLTLIDIRIPPPSPSMSPAPAAQTDLPLIPTLDRLLSILEAAPSLQELSLANCLPRPDSTSHIVPLRHMNKLSLKGSLSETVAILERVSLPGSASLSLRCPGHNPLDGLVDKLISLLITHFRTPESPLSTMTIAKADFAPYFTIMVWDTDVSNCGHCQFVPPSSPRLYLTLGNALVESLPLKICKGLPLQDLHSLSTMYPDAIWSIGEWEDVCSHCPKVAHLRLGGRWAVNLAPTLAKPTVFPALDTLVLRDIDFFTSIPEGMKHLGFLLPVILRARIDAGIRVRSLEITSCVVDSTWMESFYDLVNEFVWDHEQGFYDEGFDITDSQPSSAVDYYSWVDDE